MNDRLFCGGNVFWESGACLGRHHDQPIYGVKKYVDFMNEKIYIYNYSVVRNKLQLCIDRAVHFIQSG